MQSLTFQDSDLSKGFKNDPGGIFLKGLFNLSYLDLGNNELTNLHDNLFQDQSSSLRYLILQDNLLRNIPKAILKVKRLKVLDIQNNKLLTLSKRDTQILDAIKGATIRISQNPFDCSCQNLHMIKWLIQNEKRIEDYDRIHCTGGVDWKNLTVHERHFELNCISTFWLELSASLSIVIILAIIVSVIGYRYRRYIEYLFLLLVYSHLKAEHSKHKYEFDGFISHSHFDDDWVLGTLYKRLTDEMGMKISLYHKDFMPGELIDSEIVRCIDKSRKVIFVVSQNFIASEWANYELEIAISHVFECGRTGLLVIIKDEVHVEEMPDILKRIWWKVVCMKWHDNQTPADRDLFWHNLKLAMEASHELQPSR